ncbi:Kae1-associated serine/threonine protein kinase [Candidatus Woesearchaeota archaeon]|nr:Kae1-associated serine/threonine protein kinase [Candidatus Woesearchaeota archaeon]
MEEMKEIARGAEAVLYEKDGKIIKDRLAKSYRHPDLDSELRRQRTRREAKLLKDLKVPHPALIESDNSKKIVMEKIEGAKVREILDKDPTLAQQIGEIVADLHNSDWVHGDLTTSNIILRKEGLGNQRKGGKGEDEIVLIDFGLSFQTHKVEDKAVDIHLFKQALESKHFKVYDEALAAFLQGYRKAKDYKEVLKRIEEVEARGRYRKG